MSDLPPPWDPGAPPSTPGAPPAFPDAVELPPSTPSYAHWTREPLIYFWVLLRGRRIGCLWGSSRHQAAGFLLAPDVSEAEMYAADVWEDRLAEAYARDMQAAEAVRRWKGAAEDQVGGAIPADEEERRAPSLQALHEVVAPGFPAPEGPSVQDGLFEDGTPADRSAGFGPLFSAPPPTYPEQAAGPVRALPVTLAGTVVGYVWASADGQAAGLREQGTGRNGGRGRGRAVEDAAERLPPGGRLVAGGAAPVRARARGQAVRGHRPGRARAGPAGPRRAARARASVRERSG
ncbi:hypothetical protein [Actinomadura madurae]|uniref:hypothetical protein n=1 Tax=Actinomadura madurae TaxID=1993 RepID=UPI0020D1FE31|nr:hypothetical protein [Actinomadura madurae]MCQ0008431.1 hypothetical protein [Actinomadura madurae]